MSTTVLAVLILTSTAAVVVALFMVMWRERRSDRQASVALVSGGVLAAWAITTTVLAARGSFLPPETRTVPPFAIALAVGLIGLTAALTASGTLRSLLTNQQHLIRLNVWRLLGVLFLLLMVEGQVPAVWAIPSGVGDILIGATAFWVAGQLDTPHGRRRAIVFNLLGLLDLVVAIGLGMMTSPGPTQIIHTTPESTVMTRFPMALVPTFLVPLAFMLHLVSLRQLYGARWAPGLPVAAVRS